MRSITVRSVVLVALAAVTGLATLPQCALGQTRAPVQVRERRDVTVHGVTEVWELQWMSATVPACAPDEADPFTCPCVGFEYSEVGRLDLVRFRAGREIDRLHVTPLFDGYGTPAPGWPKSAAVLPRWSYDTAADFAAYYRADSLAQEADDSASAAQPAEAFAAMVYRRPPPTILAMADLNNDGDTTEFVLHVGNMPCGKQLSLAIGLTRDRPTLHAFGTAEHPRAALSLYRDYWLRLSTLTTPTTLPVWECDDHGSNEHRQVTLSVDRRGIHAIEDTFTCHRTPNRRLRHQVL